MDGTLKITPNPDPLEGSAVLEWTIKAPAVGEVCLAEDGGEEKVVCRGRSGSSPVAGLRAGCNYIFRLYSKAEPRQLLDERAMQQADIPWARILERLKGAPRDRVYNDQLAELLAQVLPFCLRRKEFGRWFKLWEAHGAHVSRVHFYEPIPDSRALPERLWERSQDLVGFDLNEKSQLHFLREVLPRYQAEYEQIPLGQSEAGEGEFYFPNGRFDGLDAIIAYCIIRHFGPRQIIEVGSGFSTLLLARAARANGATTLDCIEPYPVDFLRAGVDGVNSLRTEKVEEVPLAEFDRLAAGDVLFIDTSHVVRTGGDVNHLYLQVLPRLRPGVLVHIHDIFLPFEYPRDWIMEDRRFWTEQYLLQAFLIGNTGFEVLVGTAYLSHFHGAELARRLPQAEPGRGGSFWMRRKKE
ncbi:MAG: class I SAM-dependent methyltransferase [Chthoniobacterales bacterium]